MKIIILIALRGVKFPEGGAAPVAPPGYALGAGGRCKSSEVSVKNFVLIFIYVHFY